MRRPPFVALILATWLVSGGCHALAQAPSPDVPPSAGLEAQARAAGSGVTGTLRRHVGVASRYLKATRDIWVYLPPGYAQAGAQRYPVLYMHDGNNLFDPQLAFGGQEWHVDESCQRLIESGALPPLIVVGVANTAERLNEYTWIPATLDGKTAGGNGAAYGRFLVSELKPLIDRTYRTRSGREDTGVLGSSLGGLESLYLARHHGDVFGKVGVMSPSVWWAQRAVLGEVAQMPQDLRLYLDMGGREGDTPKEELENARALVQRLRTRGYREGRNFHYVEDAAGGHDELAWAYRLPGALQFLYGATAGGK